MAADFYSILDNFKNFIGGRTVLFHWCLFCLAVVMLFFLGRKYQEEKQTVRFLVWPTILVLLFLFNPLFIAVLQLIAIVTVLFSGFGDVIV